MDNSMIQMPLYEISRCKIPANKGDVPFLSWENSVLTVATEKIVHLFRFSHNLQCLDKKIDWILTDIPCPKSSPATSLFSRKLMKENNINNLEYNQLMMDPALWPHNIQLMEEMANIVSYQWSPPNFMHNNESVITILNNVGNVELFGPTRCGFSSFLNISSVIESKFKENLQGNLPENVEEVKKAANAVETSSFCWGAQSKGKFNLVMAQKNGDIYFWQLECDNKGTNVEELLVQHSDAGESVTMQWITISDDTFLLILTNILGQLHVYKYEWENNLPKLINCDSPWPHKDRMVIKYLKYTILDGKIMLICNKHRHLLILLMDENCNKVSEYVNNLNDHKISAITRSINCFYVCTINCKIYKVNVSLLDGKLNVTRAEIAIKENLNGYDLCGLAYSKNNVICALGVISRKIMHRKESTSIDLIFLCKEESHMNEMVLLLENPTMKLSDYWDCIETIRCKVMKLKMLPSIDFNQLYSSISNLYAMKVYLILLTYYHSLESILKNKSKGLLPETSLETAKERILALQASYIVKNTQTKIVNKEIITDLISQSFVDAKKYLKYYCTKYKLDLAEFIPSSVHNIKEENKEYACQCCDEKIVGFSCQNGHLNLYCSLTLTPIESDEYLCCPACGILARKELLPENPMCLFCDLPLNNIFLPSSIKSSVSYFGYFIVSFTIVILSPISQKAA